MNTQYLQNNKVNYKTVEQFQAQCLSNTTQLLSGTVKTCSSTPTSPGIYLLKTCVTITKTAADTSTAANYCEVSDGSNSIIIPVAKEKTYQWFSIADDTARNYTVYIYDKDNNLIISDNSIDISTEYYLISK